MKKFSNLNGNFEYELLDKNQQNPDLRKKLALLYASPFADILWWELRDNSLINDGYYKLFYYEHRVLKHIVLFKYSAKSGKKIFVINISFKISIKDIENICHILFNEFDKLQQIIFERLFTLPEKLPKMIFEKDISDIIVSLPESMDAYLKSIGTKSRKKYIYATNRIGRDFPDFKVHNFEKSNILYEQIEELVSLKCNRFKARGIKSEIDDEEGKMLYQYTSSDFGFLCLCTTNDKIICGMINTIIGEHAYAHITAHDISYDKYSASQIAWFYAIKYLIEEKKVKYFHMLGGGEKYKFRLGGDSHERYIVRIFRNIGTNYFLLKINVTYKEYKQKLRDHDYYQRLKNNKNIYGFYIKLKKIKTKIQGG